MTSAPLSARDRRALRLGLWIALPGLVFGGLLAPYLRARAARVDRIASERSLLERELALIAESRRFGARFSRAEAALLEEAPRLFGGEDAALAANGLATHVTALAVQRRVFVQSQDARPADSVSAGLQPLELELQVVSDLSGVLNLIHDLEDGTKLVRLQRLAIGRAESTRGLGDAANDGALWARLTLRGYGLASAAPPPAATAR